jgi:hypothetical protein
VVIIGWAEVLATWAEVLAVMVDLDSVGGWCCLGD